MKKALILVADNWRARLLSMAAPAGKLVEIEDLLHASARKQNRELGSDKPGRSFESVGKTRHALEEPTPLQEKELETFVKQVNSRLEQHMTGFDTLHIVAPPTFLGKLRPQLSSTTQTKLAHEVPKNVLEESPESLHQRLVQIIPF